MMHRTIDANINRVCEGLRVIEDILRFELDMKVHLSDLKKMRHFLREDFSVDFKKTYLEKRDSINDGGKEFSETETNRKSLTDLLKANFYRIEEGLRVLEEAVKLIDEMKRYSPTIKSFRFEIYEIEKKVLS
jgi:thiamine-phosphate pyrophosphorylase